MAMSPSDAAELLGRALREDRLAVLVGSRASADAVDRSGRRYDGLPTPRQFVELCAKQFGYISAQDDFNQAADKIVLRDGRQRLEEVLLRYYQVPGAFDAPPAHRMLAWLPISLFLTSNYDQFIERSLEREGRVPHVLIENPDLARMKRWQTPVVKYHGCVTRPSTLVAASPDYDTLEERRALIADYIGAALAGKTILVVGHGLADHDFARILNKLVGRLAEYAPAVFVLREEGHDGHLPGLRFSAEVVSEDLTQFLSRLLQQARHSEHNLASGVFDEQWMASAFFAALRQASVLPSETQVIDAFLEHLHEEISARDAVPDVLADADSAVKLALRTRPNYEALRKTWQAVQDALTPLSDTASAEIALDQFREERGRAIEHFRRLGAQHISRNERILLFSQSQRVVQFLLGVPQSVQRTIHLFVAECRPKSPLPYQDAAAFCGQLADTYYSITVCPDVVAGHLLSSHQIDRVVMGTHAVFSDPSTGVPHSFVNTCGARLLTLAALKNGVPVDVIGETLKIALIESAKARDSLHIHQESDLLENAVGLRDIRTRRSAVEHLNVGYDLIPIEDGITMHIPDQKK
jgi:translation initiation factor 2B subunit (eIF-2B alpha/beta/delta family)